MAAPSPAWRRRRRCWKKRPNNGICIPAPARAGAFCIIRRSPLAHTAYHSVGDGASHQRGIAAMVSLCDCATANNTVAIIVGGDMARDA